jgi:spore germination cell wall hydrolase CwlJ-like protein
MGLLLRRGAIALAIMALVAGHPASADTPSQPTGTTIAMNLPTTGLSSQWATLQPAITTAQQTFATLADKVAATVADVAAVDDQLRCLATAIYFEARSEPVEGQLAVAQVVRNRARSGRFPASLCGVVYQRSQFSFSHRRSPDNQMQWTRALKIAAIAMTGGWRDIVPEALYFHAARVSPGWGRQRIARVGNNIFYR